MASLFGGTGWPLSFVGNNDENKCSRTSSSLTRSTRMPSVPAFWFTRLESGPHGALSPTSPYPLRRGYHGSPLVFGLLYRVARSVRCRRPIRRRTSRGVVPPMLHGHGRHLALGRRSIHWRPLIVFRTERKPKEPMDVALRSAAPAAVNRPSDNRSASCRRIPLRGLLHCRHDGGDGTIDIGLRCAPARDRDAHETLASPGGSTHPAFT
jgi:hypothetical protein